MDSYMTLYCIRQKSTDICVLRSNNRTMPLFFARVQHAKGVLTTMVNRMGADPNDYTIHPVYVTISRLSVDEMAELDKADSDVKQQIKDLGLVHHKGGK